MVLFGHQFIAVLTLPLAFASCSAGAGSECLASDESEESVMLQMRAGPSRTLKKGTGKASSVESKMVQLVTNVIAGKETISDATREALDDIDTEMESVIANAAQLQEENQQEVNRARDSIIACATTLNDNFVSAGGINDVSSTVDADRSAHNTCRENEQSLKADMDMKCSDLLNYANNLEPPACIRSYVPALTPQNLQCIQDTATWSAENSALWVSKAGLCNASTDAHTAKRIECNAAQGAFESSFCTYEEKLTSSCGSQTSCRTFAINQRDTAHAEVKIAEAAFKAEYTSAKHVQCLLDVLNATEDADKPGMLTSCLDADIDVGHLDIAYPEVPEEMVCNAGPVATFPCVGAWLTAEYEEKTWYSEAPIQTCAPCANSS